MVVEERASILQWKLEKIISQAFFSPDDSAKSLCSLMNVWGFKHLQLSQENNEARSGNHRSRTHGCMESKRKPTRLSHWPHIHFSVTI